LLGDDYGTLSALIRLARRYPNIIFELKTKSRRTDWIDAFDVPSNIVAAWSLNAPTVIMKEEHLTATLEQRLDAAQATAEAGIMIGFTYIRWFV
jgi:spore photoproduct lyase